MEREERKKALVDIHSALNHLQFSGFQNAELLLFVEKGLQCLMDDLERQDETEAKEPERAEVSQ